MTVLVVAPVDHRAARYAIETWHYSHRVPASPGRAFGVWEDERFIGVVLFGRGASPNIGKPYQLTQWEIVELTRVALRAHAEPVSRIVMQAVSELRRNSPGLRAIVSFADPMHGHRGGIYQAMNWLYLGETEPTPMFRSKTTGELFHQRVVPASGVVRQFGKWVRAPKRENMEKVAAPGKHRYLLPLDKAMRRRVAPYAQPYPPAVEVSTVTR